MYRKVLGGGGLCSDKVETDVVLVRTCSTLRHVAQATYRFVQLQCTCVCRSLVHVCLHNK